MNPAIEQHALKAVMRLEQSGRPLHAEDIIAAFQCLLRYVDNIRPTADTLVDVVARLENNCQDLEGALKACLPMLIRLGDFIGNGEERLGGPMARCDLIFRIQAMLNHGKDD